MALNFNYDLDNNGSDDRLETVERIKRALTDGSFNIDKPVINDNSATNEISSVDLSNKLSYSPELKESLSNDQKELWEREDEIRKHVEEREDSAYQRAVADMKKAGINPELLGVNPASSGGGITSASRIDNSLLNTELSGAYSELIAQLNNEVKVDENQKDRILSIVNNFVDLAGKVLMFKFLKK